MSSVYAADRDSFLDTVAAELTLAAYGVVLHSGVPANWVDLELGLWRVLADRVRARAQGFDGWAGTNGIGVMSEN
jgi:hypothetical protein